MSSLLSEIFMEAEGGTIPVGPYQTNPAPVTGCAALDFDIVSLITAISFFNNSPATPSPDPRITSQREKARTSLRVSLESIIRKLTANQYPGCTRENRRKAAQRIRRIRGIWVGGRGIRDLRLRLLRLLSR